MEQINNKVASSTLEIFDLEDYFPIEKHVDIDLSQWLFEGFVLKEKDFREQLKNHNWSQYLNCNITISVPDGIIIPAWATILVTVQVVPFAKNVVVGNYTDLLNLIYQKKLNTIDFSVYLDKPVILKGCSKQLVPESAYILAVQHLFKFAKSIMYGEACSAVPLFKKGK